MRLGKYAVLAGFMMAMGFSATQVLAATPKAWWKFEGSAPGKDWTGNGFDATLVGDATIDIDRPTAGVMGTQSLGSMRFGGNGYLSVANGANLIMGQANYSLAFWFKVYGGGVTTSMAMFSKDNNGAGITGAKVFGINGNNNNGKLSYDNYGSGGSFFSAKNTLNDGNWHHVVVSQRSRNAAPVSATETFQLYIDGAATADVTGSSNSVLDSAISANPTVWIGRGVSGSWGGSNNFIGWIDDMKFFDVALTPADVAQEYNKNASGVSSITVTPTAATFPKVSTITGPSTTTLTITVKNNNATGLSPLEFVQQGTEAFRGIVPTGAAASRFIVKSVTPKGVEVSGLAPQSSLSIVVDFKPTIPTDYVAGTDSTQRASLSLFTNINGTPQFDIPLTGPLVPVGMSSFSAQ